MDIIQSSDVKDHVLAQLANSMGPNLYDCTRVWSAWSYGTMGPNDFSSVIDNDERMADLANTLISTTNDHLDGDTPDAIMKAIHEAFVNELGTVYFNEEDLTVQDSFTDIGDMDDEVHGIVFDFFLVIAPYTLSAEWMTCLATTLRQDERWVDMADMAARHPQVISFKLLQEAARHLGDDLAEPYQRLLTAWTREQGLLDQVPVKNRRPRPRS